MPLLKKPKTAKEALKSYCARSGCVGIKLKMLIYSM